jgi:hypothetical protein
MTAKTVKRESFLWSDFSYTMKARCRGVGRGRLLKTIILNAQFEIPNHGDVAVQPDS